MNVKKLKSALATANDADEVTIRLEGGRRFDGSLRLLELRQLSVRNYSFRFEIEIDEREFKAVQLRSGEGEDHCSNDYWYWQGYADGKQIGYADGYAEGNKAGYRDGYKAGHRDGLAAAAPMDAKILPAKPLETGGASGSGQEISGSAEEFQPVKV